MIEKAFPSHIADQWKLRRVRLQMACRWTVYGVMVINRSHNNWVSMLCSANDMHAVYWPIGIVT